MVGGRARSIYDAQAKARQVRKASDSVPANLPEQIRDARDAVGKTVGVSGKTVDFATRVLTLLQDEEWGQWSDHEIARRCGVGQPFVSRERSLIPGISEKPRTYITKHGTEATMHVESLVTSV